MVLLKARPAERYVFGEWSTANERSSNQRCDGRTSKRPSHQQDRGTQTRRGHWQPRSRPCKSSRCLTTSSSALEVVRYEKEEPAKTLYAEAKKVQAAFAADNPGYTLALSPIRSLEKQVKLWNENTSIHQAGMNLVTRMRKELEKDKYPAVPEPASIATFRDVLRKAFMSPEPTNAAPGTSDHGRATAVDFVVMRAGVPIASTKTAEIPTRWQHDGWEAKLIKACKGTRLKGPLKKPYEPWHWVLQQ